MLVGLGFEEESQRGVYIFFAVGDSEPLLRYAWHEPDEPVTAVDLTKAKSMLHWKGLLERDEFDDWATDDEVRLLIFDVFDSERRHFERLKAKFEGTRRADNLRKPIPESVRIFVWQRDGGKCVNCGSQEGLEYDHVIPVSKGGSNTARNIQLLCESCNRSKADKIA